VFESRVPRRIFWPQRYEVTGEWKRPKKEELNDLNSSPNIIWVIKSRRMRWVGACSLYEGRGMVHTVFWWGNLREGDHL